MTTIRTILITAAVAALAACGGGGGGTAQGAAKEWLKAATANDEAAVMALTMDDATHVLKVVEIMNDPEEPFTLDNVSWSPGGNAVGGDLEWHATKGAQIVTLTLKEVSPGVWKVRDAAISW